LISHVANLVTISLYESLQLVKLNVHLVSCLGYTPCR